MKIVFTIHVFFVFLFTCLNSSSLFSQDDNYKDTLKVYQQVVEIDKLTASPGEKLKKLFALKKIIEYRQQQNDTGYILTLLKLAKNIYLNDYNIDSALKYNLLAVKINNANTYKISNTVLINAYYNLATYYYFQHLYSASLPYYDSVVQLARKYDTDNCLAETRFFKAQVYFLLGDYQSSVEEYTRGLSENNLKTSFDTLQFIRILNFRAQSLMMEDKLQEGLIDIAKELPLAQKINSHFQIATAYKTKALVYEKMGQFQKAESFFKLAIRERLLTNDNINIASDYNDLGNFYLNSLRNYKASKIAYHQTIKYGEKIINPNDRSLKLFMAYEDLGSAETNTDNYKAAIQLYDSALRCINIILPDFLTTNPPSTQLLSVGNNNVLFAFLFGKVELLLKLCKKDKQETYLKACIQTAFFTDSIITQIRYQQTGEESKLYWRDKTRGFFNNAIEACYLNNDANNAFYFMEKSRAVLLYDKLNELGAAAHLSLKETNEKERLQAKLIAEQQNLSSLDQNSLTYKTTENNYLQTKDSLERYVHSLESIHPAYYQYTYSDNVPSLSSLQNFLAQNNQSFIHYYVNDTAIYALGISKNKTSFIKVRAADFNSNNLSEFIQLCSNKQALMHNYDSFSTLSKTIYTKLFQPLQIDKGNVAICTDNFFIPFEALCTDNKGKNYLLYNYNFSYVYSARSLMKTFPRSAATGNFVGFAPVSFASSLGVVSLLQSATALQSTALFYSNHTLFTEQKATRSSFFTEAPHYSVVTIFSHAQADTTDKEPVLYMCDSVIHLSELQLMKNPSIQFVLLSACQTNIGKNAAGEGIYSLARGFASVGIPSVSATLWNADEKTIYQISTKFNEYLAKGMNKSEALQKAKIWFLTSNKNSEQLLPYYWANMVLIGSSQPLILSSSNHLWLWIAGIVAITVCTLLYFFFAYHRKKLKASQFNVLERK